MTRLIFSDTEAAPAKINLSLEVLERRSDNYHNLQSLMVTIDLQDQLSLFLSSDHGRKWRVSSDDASVPENENNLAYTAALAFFNYYGIDPSAYFLDLKIEKRIPSQAGLGGGSTDAAATIRLLERAFFPDGAESMPEAYMAHEIGADVPYCYHGGTQFVSGIGNVLAAQESFPVFPLLLLKPPVEISTGEAFAALNKSTSSQQGSDYQEFLSDYEDILRQEEYSAFENIFHNSFLPYVAKVHPQIDSYLAELRQTGCFFSSLSGSGPSVYALYEMGSDLNSIRERMAAKFPRVAIYESKILNTNSRN